MNRKITQLLERHRAEIIEAWYANQFSDSVITKYNIRGLESDDRTWVRPSFLDPLFHLLMNTYAREKNGIRQYIVMSVSGTRLIWRHRRFVLTSSTDSFHRRGGIG